MSAVQADTLAYYVGKLEGVTSVKVQERVQDADVYKRQQLSFSENGQEHWLVLLEWHCLI